MSIHFRITNEFLLLLTLVYPTHETPPQLVHRPTSRWQAVRGCLCRARPPPLHSGGQDGESMAGPGLWRCGDRCSLCSRWDRRPLLLSLAPHCWKCRIPKSNFAWYVENRIRELCLSPSLVLASHPNVIPILQSPMYFGSGGRHPLSTRRTSSPPPPQELVVAPVWRNASQSPSTGRLPVTVKVRLHQKYGSEQG